VQFLYRFGERKEKRKTMKFEDLNLIEPILKALTEEGYRNELSHMYLKEKIYSDAHRQEQARQQHLLFQ